MAAESNVHPQGSSRRPQAVQRSSSVTHHSFIEPRQTLTGEQSYTADPAYCGDAISFKEFDHSVAVESMASSSALSLAAHTYSGATAISLRKSPILPSESFDSPLQRHKLTRRVQSKSSLSGFQAPISPEGLTTGHRNASSARSSSDEIDRSKEHVRLQRLTARKAPAVPNALSTHAAPSKSCSARQPFWRLFILIFARLYCCAAVLYFARSAIYERQAVPHIHRHWLLAIQHLTKLTYVADTDVLNRSNPSVEDSFHSPSRAIAGDFANDVTEIQELDIEEVVEAPMIKHKNPEAGT